MNKNGSLTIAVLKELIKDLPDEMDVVVSNVYHNATHPKITGLYLAVTAGILQNLEIDGFCISSSVSDIKLDELIRNNDSIQNHISCKEVLF